MPQQNKDQIQDLDRIRDYRTELPNIIDDFGLTVYGHRLYSHYKRACGPAGSCEQGVRYIADVCKISTGQVSEAKKELVTVGLIWVKEAHSSNGIIDNVSLPDLWEWNFQIYFVKDDPQKRQTVIEAMKCSLCEHPIACSSRELLRSRGERLRSSREQKKEHLKKEHSKNNTEESILSEASHPTTQTPDSKNWHAINHMTKQIVVPGQSQRVLSVDLSALGTDWLRVSLESPDEYKGYTRVSLEEALETPSKVALKVSPPLRVIGSFNPAMVRTAMNMRGMTAERLTTLTHIPPEMMQAYMDLESTPLEDDLIKIGAALQVAVSFLFLEVFNAEAVVQPPVPSLPSGNDVPVPSAIVPAAPLATESPINEIIIGGTDSQPLVVTFEEFAASVPEGHIARYELTGWDSDGQCQREYREVHYNKGTAARMSRDSLCGRSTGSDMNNWYYNGPVVNDPNGSSPPYRLCPDCAKFADNPMVPAPKRTRWINPLDGDTAHLVSDTNLPTSTLCGINPVPSYASGGESKARQIPCQECLKAAHDRPKSERKPQPTDPLFNAIGREILSAKTPADIEALGWSIGTIMNGDKKNKRWVGIIPYEQARQNTEELNFEALAKDVEIFWKWYQKEKPGYELKDCKPFGENWVKWRGTQSPSQAALVDDPENPGKKVRPQDLKIRDAEKKMIEAQRAKQQ